MIVVGRVLGWRSWLRSPIASTLSWRIQRALRSPWNHVACYLGGPGRELAEADWHRGVVVRPVADLLSSREHRCAIVRPPARVDRAAAVAAWRGAASASKGRRSYSVRMLILMRIAALLYGAEGIRDVVRNNPRDGAWVCSELGAAGWAAACSGGLADLLITPRDFMEQGIVERLGLEVCELIVGGAVLAAESM